MDSGKESGVAPYDRVTVKMTIHSEKLDKEIFEFELQREPVAKGDIPGVVIKFLSEIYCVFRDMTLAAMAGGGEAEVRAAAFNRPNVIDLDKATADAKTEKGGA